MFIGKGRFYKVLNGFVKKLLFLNEGFHILRINLLQLKEGFLSLFQCEIKLTKR